MLGEISLWLVEEARRRLNVEVCSVMALDYEKEELIMVASMGLPKEVIAVAHGRIGKGVAGWVAAEGAPLLIKDINEDIRFMSFPKKERYYTNSLLSVPIKENDKMIGVLNLNNKHDHSPFSEEDLNKAMELVSEAHKRLFSAEIIPPQEEKLKERTSELNSIFLFSQKISASLYLSEIMNAISGTLSASLNPEVITVILFDQKRVWLFTNGEPTKPLFSKVKSHIEEKISVLDQKPAFSEFDWTTVNMASHGLSEKPIKKSLSSSISFPLLSGDREIGLVSCLRSQPFTRDELRVFAIITNTASVAVDKAILYQKLEEELDETKRELLSSEKMATVGKITAKVSHDLRNPLAVISLCLYILKDKVKDDEAIVYLDRIENSYNRMDRLCEELCDFEREMSLEKNALDLHQLIRDSLTFCEHNLTKIKKILELSPEVPPILADQRRLEQVFTNIIQNASESMGEEGMLRIETKKEQDFVKISFTDTGTGIADEVREKIFEPFFTTRSKGVGLGLSICKEIVEKHGGKMDVESKLGLGTTFNILLPV